MAKRRKNRTHLKGKTQREESKSNTPKTFIIKHGHVGSSISQLVRDMRKVMEPNTASRLRERNRNKLKDYITMGPALQVTHLLAFRLTPVAPSLRIIRLSDGPTLSFRVERYSLMKDILNTARHAKSMGMEYLTPPLLVLASFPQPGPGTPPHLPLVMKAFQTIFPPLSPHTISLSSARRIVLVSYNAERGTVNFRHYLIRVKAHGVSKRVRRVLESAASSSKPILDLGNEKDVADFVLRRRGEVGPEGGYESASSAESAVEDGDMVNLAGDYVGRNNKRGTKRAVKLEEVGPRLELRLVKIAEGIPGKEGNVIYHEFVKKSKKELADQKATIAEKVALRKQRREEQERNVARKKKEAKGGDGKSEAAEGSDDEEVDEDDEFDGEGDDDVGDWDDEEEISEGEESDAEEEGDLSEEESSDDEKPPTKKPRFNRKR